MARACQARTVVWSSPSSSLLVVVRVVVVAVGVLALLPLPLPPRCTEWGDDDEATVVAVRAPVEAARWIRWDDDDVGAVVVVVVAAAVVVGGG
jgi:hypothetical protein